MAKSKKEKVCKKYSECANKEYQKRLGLPRLDDEDKEQERRDAEKISKYVLNKCKICGGKK